MANEPIVSDGKKRNALDQLKPAAIAVFSLLAVLIIIFYFRIAVIVIMSPFRDILLTWTTNYDSNPFLNALYDLPYGLMLFLMAGFLILGKNFDEALSDRRWLRVDSRKKDHFIYGLIPGIIVFTAATFTITVIHIYQNKIQFPVSFHPEELLVTLIMLVPVLVMCAGKVALVQGFFQRMLSEKYGTIAGVLIAAFIFMILELFPKGIPQLWSLPFWQVNGEFFLAGAVIAYLFYRTKSLYMPIGFLFAWKITYYILNTIQLETWPHQFSPVTLIGNYPMPILDEFHLIDAMYITVGYGMKGLFLLITLAMIWHFRNKTREDLNLLKSRIKNASKSFLSNLARD